MTQTHVGIALTLSHVTFQVQKFKALRSRAAAIFSSASSICESQSSLDTEPSVRGTQPRTEPFEKRTERAFIRFPITVKQKIEKIVSKDEGASPTSGLELWPGRGGQRQGVVMVGPIAAASLWNAKKTQTPQGGLMAYASLCLSVLRSPFFLKISVVLA